MSSEALGRLFDIALGWAPANLQGGITGLRVNMEGATGCTIVVIKAAGTAGDDPGFDLKQHTAYTGGTTADLDKVDHYYLKAHTTLVNSKTWVREAQTAASEIADPGGDTTSAEEQQILVIEVRADQLSDGYSWISLDADDPANANAQYAACIYLLHGLAYPSTPANLLQLLT
jgi:hypothetical protein